MKENAKPRECNHSAQFDIHVQGPIKRTSSVFQTREGHLEIG